MATEPREVWGDLATSAFIQASLLFKSLDEEAMRDLVQLACSVRFGPGEVVLRQGHAGEHFFLIQEGSAGITLEKDGRTVELASLERGAFFGEFHVLSGAPHMATVSARTELTLIRFPSPIISALAERFPKVQRLLEAVKSARGKETAGKLVG